jgi:antitoxin ChpS
MFLYNKLMRSIDAHYQITPCGGSVMLAVPPAFLDQLQLEARATVGATVSDGQLVIHPKAKPRYTLAELLATPDYSEP